jgi:uncharacterized protein with von Willebrand factor type A (vWA) domain
VFAPDALERRLAALDRLPRSLWRPAIVNTHGSIFRRLAAVAAWRVRLGLGQPPLDRADGWPAPPLIEAFAPAVEQLGLAELARGQADLADQVARSLLWHVDRVAGRTGPASEAAAAAACAAEFFADWEPRRQDLEVVLRVFESLDGVAAFAQASVLRGVLRSAGWQEVLAAHDRLARMPRLAALIRRLGRARPSGSETLQPRAAARPPEPALAWVRRLHAVELPGAPLETQGVRRTGDLGRLLASEVIVLRRHAGDSRRGRRLRRLFAARLAEHTLLGYEQRQWALEPTWVREPGAPRPERPAPQPALEAGPLILCVDTSASMRGAPEQVAKAIVLEAMRAAASARRPCLVFAFGGPGQVRELVLGPGVEGLATLAGLLAESFHGGTDIVEPVRRALARVAGAPWRQADLLIASDGEFGATADVVAELAAARRATGLRVQGILVGDRETIGLAELCDDIFWVRDWRRYGGAHGQIEPPIHASNLTALYFPGAFVGREGAGRGPAGPAPRPPSGAAPP